MNAPTRSLPIILMLLAGGVAADDHGNLRAPAHPAWKAECSSCHVAYPPGLLSAPNWRTMMGDLKHHFGSDATLDDKTRADILTFLEANAARDADRSSAPSLRITETPRFKRMHHEVPVRYWNDKAVKRGANCAACHTAADKGNFSEHGIRMPDGRPWEDD